MALVVPLAWQCRLKWSQPTAMSHGPQNVFGIYLDPSTNPSLDQATTNAIRTAFDNAFTTAALAASFPATCDPIELLITDIRTATGPQFSAIPTTNCTGTADPLPGEISLVTTLHTALRGKSYRGRWYWPSPVSGVNTSSGRPTSTFVTACTTFMTSFDSNVNALTGLDGLGVISRSLSHIQQMTSATTNNSWDSQRRRGFK